MQHTLLVGWGKPVARVAECWLEYNKLYFSERLLPLPIFLTPTAPYGSRLGWLCCCHTITHIALVCPQKGEVLVADRDTLLHEMIHQCLHEQGLDPSHKGQPWRDEIMRLHQLISGQTIWAGRYTVGKKKVGNGEWESVRLNRPDPVTGQTSLRQSDIARWPHSVGINLGPL
jgi:hypothetical protein